MTDESITICGAVADFTTALIVAPPTITSESPVVPMSTSMSPRSHLRTMAS